MAALKPAAIRTQVLLLLLAAHERLEQLGR
jgi:hypothetical protein